MEAHDGANGIARTLVRALPRTEGPVVVGDRLQQQVESVIRIEASSACFSKA